jgi:DNA primase
MPYRDNQGKIIALVGRSLLNDADREEKKVHKYKNTTKFKKGNVLFGLYENKQYILDQNCVYVVEGQFDVIKAVEKGFSNIVGLGTASMTPYQFSVISRYTDNIRLLLDNDDTGEKGRKLILGKFGKLANIQNFYLLDSFKDIDEYFTKSGEDSVSFVVRA